jgi:hypothetical protein
MPTLHHQMYNICTFYIAHVPTLGLSLCVIHPFHKWLPIKNYFMCI